MAQQEWILSNWRETFDKWQGEDPLTGEQNAQFRQYRAYFDRYCKYTPPLAFSLFDVDQQVSINLLTANAINQIVSADSLSTYDGIASPIGELLDRTLSFNTAESGILTITESWEIYDLIQIRINDEWTYLNDYLGEV